MSLKNLVLLPIFLITAACAVQPKWTPDTSSRDLAVVRVSYEHLKTELPALRDSDAVKLAMNRCSGWGFERAEMIPGELLDCSVNDANGCELWKVTREYRCTGEGSSSRIAAR